MDKRYINIDIIILRVNHEWPQVTTNDHELTTSDQEWGF